MKILILGTTGMLGSAFFTQLSNDRRYQVYGTMRNSGGLRFFSEEAHSYIYTHVDVLNQDSLIAVFERSQPNVVVNCVGMIKQHAAARDPLITLPINSILPHRLARLCGLVGARLIHISTDCVFSGAKGMYSEADIPDAEDLYGKSKLIGEIHDLSYAVTLRTSIIGHELDSHHALVDWFLSQTHRVKGYSKAVFSGLTTIELVRVVCEYVIPKPELSGLYHVSSDPIDKMSLLRIVAEVYGKDIEIVPDEQVFADRSLDSSRFREVTGYVPPGWKEMIEVMHVHR